MMKTVELSSETKMGVIAFWEAVTVEDPDENAFLPTSWSQTHAAGTGFSNLQDFMKQCCYVAACPETSDICTALSKVPNKKWNRQAPNKGVLYPSADLGGGKENQDLPLRQSVLDLPDLDLDLDLVLLLELILRAAHCCDHDPVRAGEHGFHTAHARGQQCGAGLPGSKPCAPSAPCFFAMGGAGGAE